MHSMAMGGRHDLSGSCCQMHKDNIVAPPKASFLAEHLQSPLLLPRVGLESRSSAVDLRLNERAHLPPGISPGSGFVLRI